MGTLTVSLEDSKEAKLRKLAALKFGKRKGHLSEALEEAIDVWAEKGSSDAEGKMMALLEKGFKMGKMLYKERAELHER